MKRIFIFGLLLFTTAAALQAQPYKIRLVDKGNRVVGVQLQIAAGTAPTTGTFLVDLTFGIKWSSNPNVNMGTLIQNPSNSYAVNKSGAKVTKTVGGATYDFQAFSVPTAPYYFPADWAVGTWIDIVSINMTGSAASVSLDVCPTNFDVTVNPYINVDLDDFTLVIDSGISVVLPLELLSFTAKSTAEQTALIAWQTAHEENVAAFELQRSSDSKNWGPLSIVTPKNGLLQNYTFEDTKPLTNINYYRLKMVDRDGSFHYSPTKSVVFSQKQRLIVSPNPLKAGTLVHIQAETEAACSVILTDVTGRILGQSTFKGETWLPTEGLANGIYFIQSTTKGFLETRKIVIQ